MAVGVSRNINLTKGWFLLVRLLWVFWFFFTVLLVFDEAQALCVSHDRANLRKGAGTHYRKLWEVYKYMPFKKLGSKGVWYRVQDLDGDKYWIHKRLTTSIYKCAAVKKEKANFRKGPGTKYKKVSWSGQPKYFSMKVLKKKGAWVYVEDEQKDRAWVHRTLIWIQ